MKFSLVLITFVLTLSALKIDVDAHFKENEADERRHGRSSSKKPSSQKPSSSKKTSSAKPTSLTIPTEPKTSFSFYSTFSTTTDPPIITTIVNSPTGPQTNGTTLRPPNNMCPPVSCKQIYCKKKTSFIYLVISVKIETKLSIIYNIKIIDSFKGLLPTFKTGTLELPKNNTKHKIQLNKKFLFMSSYLNSNSSSNIVLTTSCYNKLHSLLSLAELAFFGNNPNKYCQEKETKCDCRYKKCIKKCSAHCKNCDDIEECEKSCEVQCKYIIWYHNYTKQPHRPRALSSEEL